MSKHHKTTVGVFASLTMSIASILSSGSLHAESADGVLPANAKPGECYAKVMVPAEYKTDAEKVVIRDASNKIEVIPAKYETTEMRVAVKEAAKKLVVVPATYKTVEEQVEIEPAQTVWRTAPDEKAKIADPRLVAVASALGVASDAKPGQCFKEFYKPAEYKTETQRLLSKEAAEIIAINEPQYKFEEERVLVKEASSKIVEVPAQFEEVQEQVLESPAYSTWKVGKGPNQRIDNATGEIMCLVEVPAKYRTVTKRVLKTPASTKVIEIPAQYSTVRVSKLAEPAKQQTNSTEAEYQTIEKRIKVSDAKISWHAEGAEADNGKATGNRICLTETPAKYQTVSMQMVKTPATVKTVEIPADYKVMKVTKLVSPAQDKRIEIPATYETISKTTKVKAAYQAWQPVLCETNTTRELITQIQQSLKTAGFNPGDIDGVIGRDTLTALDGYQRKNDLARGGVTMETLEKLGVKLGS